MIPDTILVARAQRGDRSATEELVRRHRRRAENVALSFFVDGHEREDLRQEAVVGLLSAIRSFRPELGQPFAHFFPFCVYRQLVTCLRESQRDKHRSLAGSLRVGTDDETGDTIAFAELLPDPRADVPRFAEARAELGRVVREIAAMPDKERRSLIGVAFGYSYREIEETFGIHSKGADNAIQRARHKLRKAA